MNEYIPREDVSVNVKNGLSKIVDELPEDVTGEDLKRLNYCLHVNQVVQRIIRDIPTADVREVVECRNCIHWHSGYHDAVQWAVICGVTEGTSDTAFSPQKTCTRAEAVTFLWRAAGAPAPTVTENPFGDVPEDAYYRDAVLWAVERRITNGTAADAFSPDEQCTRAQIAAFLFRAAESPETAGDLPFVDVPARAYYADAVRWAAEQGITNGTDSTHFSPRKTCTRAEIVTFLQRAAD